MNHWYFIFTQWFKRDIEGRYRGSWLGMLWPLIQPLSQIAMFTLILHEFMQVRWPSGAGSNAGDTWVYAQNVLAGLTVFNFFSEILGRSPTAVLSQPNLVTKVKFPLFLLPAVTVGTALVHVGVGVVILMAASATIGGWSVHFLWLPLWLVPAVLYGLSLALLLSSVGVYARDIGQAMPAFTGLLMFMTPIFYPITAVPERMRSFFDSNPLTWAIEALRGLLMHSQALDLQIWFLHLTISAGAAAFAAWVFRHLQEGFADVL